MAQGCYELFVNTDPAVVSDPSNKELLECFNYRNTCLSSISLKYFTKFKGHSDIHITKNIPKSCYQLQDPLVYSAIFCSLLCYEKWSVSKLSGLVMVIVLNLMYAICDCNL